MRCFKWSLSGRIGKVVPQMSELSLRFPAEAVLICTLEVGLRGVKGVNSPVKGWGINASQLDLQSLTPLPVAGCGRLQPRVVNCATSV